ncbi:Uncharacterized protein TCAP_04052 [Tolypocladium capitatum]|uniref:poly(ADP-ribose) glycohydrolase n=1 Tax=Tolypocladium capitatum TaxID=45235 RepID=A0A2K3QER2_9HYPO|nr:Uncharacterized protein TCAP_04052 [Tolypocladium capitatum]
MLPRLTSQQPIEGATHTPPCSCSRKHGVDATTIKGLPQLPAAAAALRPVVSALPQVRRRRKGVSRIRAAVPMDGRGGEPRQIGWAYVERAGGLCKGCFDDERSADGRSIVAWCSWWRLPGARGRATHPSAVVGRRQLRERSVGVGRPSLPGPGAVSSVLSLILQVAAHLAQRGVVNREPSANGAPVSNRLCKDLVSHDLPDRNPFRSLLPLTRAHPLLQHVVVAASAAHMSNLMGTRRCCSGRRGDAAAPSPGVEEASRRALGDALMAKHKALALMRGALQDIDSTGGDVILAACLFFINVELIESGKHGWKAHLEGAGRIMSLLQPAAAGNEALRDYMLSDCFIYFILGSAFMPAAALDTGPFFRSSQIPHVLERAAANSYLCCPPEILGILHAASQLSNASSDADSDDDVASAGLALFQRAQAFDVDGWAHDVRNMSYLQDAPVQSRIHAGSAHRLASCLYIHQAIPSLGAIKGHDEVAEALGRDILRHLSSIPDDDPNFKATTWPTFIAGAEARSRERREWVMDRLQRLVVSCPWGFLYTAMDTLQVIWSLGGQGKGGRSWVQTLKDPDLNFLIRCLDRFSILEDQEDDNGLVQFWPLLLEVLRQPVREPSQLIDVLETISNSLRGSSGAAGDYGTLRAVVQDENHAFFTHLWPKIVRLALRVPGQFPSGHIPVLKPGGRLRLSRIQAGCLVVHQFLRTLTAPSWRDELFDFGIWYDSSQRHPQAVEMYLVALFTYLDQLEEEEAAEEGAVEYSLHSFGQTEMPPPQSWDGVPLAPAKVVNLDQYSTEQQELGAQGPGGAVVVSANKDIGFGPSATQEELHVGNCPEACPAVLLTPTLADDQVLVIQGARPMLRIEGQRRQISWSILDADARRGGRMLFMDALEIDEADGGEGLPDLEPHNLDREIKKAYTAFAAWRSPDNSAVWAGLWGCGAFNGDPAVKMTLLWMAASLAGKELRILCDPSHGDFPVQFGEFVERLPGTGSVRDLRARLDGIPPTARRLETMRWLLDG